MSISLLLQTSSSPLSQHNVAEAQPSNLVFTKKGICSVSFRCSGLHCKRFLKWGGQAGDLLLNFTPIQSSHSCPALLQPELQQLWNPPGSHQLHPGPRRNYADFSSTGDKTQFQNKNVSWFYRERAEVLAELTQSGPVLCLTVWKTCSKLVSK